MSVINHRFTTRLFVTSLLNIAIVIFGVFAFLQFSFMETVLATVQSRDQEVLRHIQKRIDENIVSLRRIALSISFDLNFSPFLLPDDPLRAIECIHDLSNYALVSTDLALVGIAYSSSRYMLSDKGSIQKEFIFAQHLPGYDVLSSEQTLRRGFVDIGDSIVFVFPYPAQASESRLGIIFMVVKKEIFRVGLQQRLANMGCYLNIAHSVTGDVLFSEGVPGGPDAVATEYVSDITGFKYHIETPRSFFSTLLNELRLKSFFVIGLLFALSLLVSFLVSAYNSKPLRGLLKQFAPDDVDESFKSVENLLFEQDAAQNRAKRIIFLLDVLRGAFVSMQDVRSTGSALQLDFSGEVLAFIEVHGMTGENEPLRSLEDVVIIEESRFFKIKSPASSDEVWVYSGSMENFSEKTLQVFRQRAYTDEALVTIGAGTATADPRNAAHSYLEALSAIKYRVVKGGGGIIRFETLPRIDTINQKELDEKIEALRRTLQGLNAMDALSAVEEIVRLCIDMSLPNARIVAWRVLQTFQDQDLIRNGIPVHQIASFESVGELMEYIRAQMATVIAKMQGVKANTDNDIVNEVKTYIEIHFDDRLLSLDSLAESLGYSVGYLCRLFKKETGITIASCIQDLRNQEACRLLRLTNLPIKDIVQRVGYMDHANFSRSFKALNGVSPQEYRNREKEVNRNEHVKKT